MDEKLFNSELKVMDVLRREDEHNKKGGFV